MHPDLHQALIDGSRLELAQSSRRALLEQAPEPVAFPAEPLLLRLCCVGDDDVLAQLAELEGLPTPRGRYVVAELAGTVVAAAPLAGGPTLADPFVETAQLMPLLELRVRQLSEPARTRPRVTFWGTVRHWSRA